MTHAVVVGPYRSPLLRGNRSCVDCFAVPYRALSDGSIPARIWFFFYSIFAFEMDCSRGLCGLGGDLRRDGFRGYMQRPIEQRHGARVAILISSLFFMALHLTKGWAMAGMVPIVFGAGVLLGLLAWSSGTLIFGMIGHVVMDVGLFAYWWTGIAGTFTARPITETGMDQSFLISCAVFATSLFIVLLAISKLRDKVRRRGATE
jgi:hypothetical protein